MFLELVKRVSEVYPELRAALVGDGELRGGVERLIEERGLKNVSLIGFDPNPYRIMARSKIVAMTSEYEGFGLVAAEAMTLSKPVLALPAGGIDEIARLAGGLCADIDDMAEKAAQLLTDAGKYDAASEAAYRASFAYTDTEAYYSKIKEIYAEAAKVVK